MNELIDTKKSYEVPERNFLTLLDRVAVLNRRAVKLGCNPIIVAKRRETLEYAYTADFEGVLWRKQGERVPENHRATGEIRRIFSVEVYGQAPKFSGWTLAATIQTSEAGNILRCVPGLEVALKPEYRTCAPACDHCKADRNRKDTFVVLHEDGTQKQVGRQCIRDFLGHTDPERLARIAELHFSLSEICDSESESWEGCGNQCRMVSTATYLAHVVAVSEDAPFITRKKSEEPPYLQPTSISASMNMFPTPRMRRDGDVIELTDRHREVAGKAIALVIETLGSQLSEQLNEFQHNLLVVAKSEGIESRTYGIAAYLVHYYRREMEEIVKRSARPVSIHFGELKKRYKGDTLVYMGSNSFPGQWGTTFIHRFLKDGGNVAVWKTNTEELAQLNSGDVVNIDYTVKGHDDYKGSAQTKITRCAINSVEKKGNI